MPADSKIALDSVRATLRLGTGFLASHRKRRRTEGADRRVTNLNLVWHPSALNCYSCITKEKWQIHRQNVTFPKLLVECEHCHLAFHTVHFLPTSSSKKMQNGLRKSTKRPFILSTPLVTLTTLRLLFPRFLMQSYGWKRFTISSMKALFSAING